MADEVSSMSKEVGRVKGSPPVPAIPGCLCPIFSVPWHSTHGAFQRRLQTLPGRRWDMIKVSQASRPDVTCRFWCPWLSLLNSLSFPFAF